MLEGIEQEILELPPKEARILGERFTDVKHSDSWRAQRRLQNASDLEILEVLYCEMFKGCFYLLTGDDTKALQNPFFRYASLETTTRDN